MANVCNDGNYRTANYEDVFPEPESSDENSDQQTCQAEEPDHTVRAVIYGAIFVVFSSAIMWVASKWIKLIDPGSLGTDGTTLIMIVVAIIVILLAMFCSRAWLRKL